jgi:hypothetical protein
MKNTLHQRIKSVWDKKKTFKTQTLVTRINMKNLVDKGKLW